MNLTGGWRFSLFNFPVRVHFSFLLIALLLGLRENNLILLALWVAIVFVSILLHELGHAIAFEHYGQQPVIELLHTGGLTIPTRHMLLTHPQGILISFAGPLAGFIFGGLLILATRFLPSIQNLYLNYIIIQLIWVNIGWGIINLVPILPLDGGNIMRSLYQWLIKPYDERTPLIISVVFGVLVFIGAIWLRQIYLALIVAFLTFRNYTMLSKGHFSDPLF